MPAKPNAFASALDEAIAEPSAPAPKKKTRAKRKPANQETPASELVMVNGRLHPDFKKNLKLIAVEDGTTTQALLGEALNMLFKKKGYKQVSM